MVGKIKENMGWIQVFTIIVATFGMFLWGQRESRSEMREFHKEIKNFHGRLCQIEEKYYQLERR